MKGGIASANERMEKLLVQVRACQICKAHLPFPPRPILQVSSKSKIIITGQAPGIKVHHTQIPWNDRSGDTLKKWLGVTDEDFYNPDNFGIIPMGFCYPGKGKNGDLPPRKECAPAWHQKLFAHLEEKPLVLLIGAYAQNYYLGKNQKKNLTQTVAAYRKYLPHYFPLPHPSPRNLMWMRRNKWFEIEIIPHLQLLVSEILFPQSAKKGDFDSFAHNIGH